MIVWRGELTKLSRDVLINVEGNTMTIKYSACFILAVLICNYHVDQNSIKISRVYDSNQYHNIFFLKNSENYICYGNNKIILFSSTSKKNIKEINLNGRILNILPLNNRLAIISFEENINAGSNKSFPTGYHESMERKKGKSWKNTYYKIRDGRVYPGIIKIYYTDQLLNIQGETTPVNNAIPLYSYCDETKIIVECSDKVLIYDHFGNTREVKSPDNNSVYIGKSKDYYVFQTKRMQNGQYLFTLLASDSKHYKAKGIFLYTNRYTNNILLYNENNFYYFEKGIFNKIADYKDIFTDKAKSLNFKIKYFNGKYIVFFYEGLEEKAIFVYSLLKKKTILKYDGMKIWGYDNSEDNVYSSGDKLFYQNKLSLYCFNLENNKLEHQVHSSDLHLFRINNFKAISYNEAISNSRWFILLDKIIKYNEDSRTYKTYNIFHITKKYVKRKQKYEIIIKPTFPFIHIWEKNAVYYDIQLADGAYYLLVQYNDDDDNYYTELYKILLSQDEI